MSIYDEIRKEYEDRGLDLDSMSACPFTEFDRWFMQAVDRSPGDWIEPNAMTLSTCDQRCRITSRIVLLKEHDTRGFAFFTNYESEKGEQLAQNPKAALLFHWAYLGRQVRIEGATEKLPRDVCEAYFHSRPHGAQVGAAASNQSAEIKSRDVLVKKVEQLAREFGDSSIPLPNSWGGYLLTPNRFEFWQGRSNRLHDRVQYRLTNNLWSRHLLSP